MEQYTDEEIFAEAARRKHEPSFFQAAQHLADGQSTKEAAVQMNISHRTVESYITKLCLSYRATNRTHLIAILFREGKIK